MALPGCESASASVLDRGALPARVIWGAVWGRGALPARVI